MTERAKREGREPTAIGRDIPIAHDRLNGVALVDVVVDSSTATHQPWSTPITVKNLTIKRTKTSRSSGRIGRVARNLGAVGLMNEKRRT